MNINDLISRLVENGFDSRKLIGHEMDDYFKEVPYFIRQFDMKWQVFHWERGQISDLKEFCCESDATEYVFREVTKSHSDAWLRSYGLNNS